MEFTYEGLVRYGFGFQNPNHAAAFICAFLPFAWMLFFSPMIRRKILGGLISAILLAALAFTYSRSGIVVLVVEALCFALYYGRKYWKHFIFMGAFLAVSLLIAGGLGRLAIDSSMTNRIDIWLAGISLFAANPPGVGLGNSGEIVSALMLTDGIDCRTLINSHLTLFCEFGIFAAFAWLVFIFYALIKGFSKNGTSKLRVAAYVSFIGLLVSSSFSTVLDFEVLLYPSKFFNFSLINIAFEWVNLALFAGLLLFLIAGNFSGKKLLTSCGISIAMLIVIFSIGKFYANAPYVKTIDGDVFITECSEPPRTLVLFDDEYDIKSALKFLRDHALDEKYFISLKSWQSKEALPKINPHKFILFGACADFLNNTPSPNILIKPSPYFMPESRNIAAVYLPKWDDNYAAARKRYEYLEIEVKDF